VPVVLDEKKTLHRWELALLLGLALALLAGTWLSGQRAALAARVIRLHIVASSNSAEDQAVKFRVRDAVLEAAQPLLTQAADRPSAETALMDHLPDLAKVGANAAGVPVTAQLEEDMWFPTKQYLDVSLPAGRYTALQIIIGEGEGRNWWGVVFPGLCADAVTEDAAESAGGFPAGQFRLLPGEQEVYEVRYKALEIWDRLTSRFAAS